MQSWANLNQQQALARWQQAARLQQLRLLRQTPQQVAEDQATQQKAEQQANEQLAHLAQEQQRKQKEHPAIDAQQAAMQQQEDAKQLKLLAVRNYQNVFLPGQVMAAMQSQLPSAKAQQDVHALTQELLNNGWWKQQASGQLAEKLAMHSANLTALSLELRRSEPTTSVATSLTPSQFDELLAADKFDQQVTSPLLREAAQVDKLAASPQLVEAIQQFTTVAAQTAATSQDQTSDQKALRKQVQTSVKRIQLELARYQARIGESGQLFQMQRTISQATASYLDKQEGKPSKR